MSRRSPRWRKPEPKQLALPTSTHVVECYAVEGKAYVFRPLFGEVAEVLLVDAACNVATARTRDDAGADWAVDEVPPGEWRVLGWRLIDRPLRHGEYDRVDPMLAEFERLPRPNRALPAHVDRYDYTPTR